MDNILEKINNIEDPELREFVLNLLHERNQLLSDVKKDTLTGLYNRRILEHVGDYSVVMMCDVDNFKCINDTFGHDKGDEVLKSVANVLSSSVRRDDVVCRYGGDEFIIIFNHCTTQLVINRVKTIQAKLYNQTDLHITLSVGISEYEDKKTLEETISQADEALYVSKSNGKNNITLHSKKDCILLSRKEN